MLKIRVLAALTLALFLLPACAEESGSVPEVPADELSSEIAELGAIHEVMRPMWHDAWPAQDYEAIRAAVAEFEPMVAALDAVTLPGILQDKQASWDEQKLLLLETFQGLKGAAEAGNNDEMMAFAEAFHMNYEGMVRIIRPLSPELDAFHQLLYGVYHYYAPGYDLEKIGNAAREMAAAIPSLQGVTLPEHLAGHQGHWETVVERLGGNVSNLMSTLQDPSREAVMAAVETVHTDYAELEGIFDSEPGSTHEH
jgi:hypothetical protein